MVRFLFVVMGEALLLMASPLPLTDDNFRDCRVEPEGVDVEQPSEVPLLAYVNVANNVTVVLYYADTNYDDEKDAVTLSSTVATHSEVRGGKATKATHRLPRLIPEGWNTFRLTVDEENLTVSLVMGDDRVTLLTLPLSRRVATVHAEGTRKGTVALCRSASPKWEGTVGGQMEVFLQPGRSGRDQCLKISDTGRAASGLYVGFPPALGSKIVRVNTTLRVTSSLRGDHVFLRVLKDANGGDGEEVMNGSVPITTHALSLVVNSSAGGAEGSITVHLESCPQISSFHTISMDTLVSIVSRYQTDTWLMVAALIVVVYVFGSVGKRLWNVLLRKKDETKNSSKTLDNLSPREDAEVTTRQREMTAVLMPEAGVPEEENLLAYTHSPTGVPAVPRAAAQQTFSHQLNGKDEGYSTHGGERRVSENRDGGTVIPLHTARGATLSKCPLLNGINNGPLRRSTGGSDLQQL